MELSCRLLAFFIKDDGEFVADHKVLNIGYNLPNKVCLFVCMLRTLPVDHNKDRINLSVKDAKIFLDTVVIFILFSTR